MKQNMFRPLGRRLGGLPRGGLVSTVATVKFSDYLIVNIQNAPYIAQFKIDPVTNTIASTTDITGLPALAGTLVNVFQMSPKGTYLCVTGTTTNSNYLKLYKRDGLNFTFFQEFPLTYQTYSCSFSEDETILAIGTNESSTTDNIKYYKLINGSYQLQAALPSQVNGVRAQVSLSRDGNTLAVHSDINANGSYGARIYVGLLSGNISQQTLLSGVASADNYPIWLNDNAILFANSTSGYRTYQRANTTSLFGTSNVASFAHSSISNSGNLKNPPFNMNGYVFNIGIAYYSSNNNFWDNGERVHRIINSSHIIPNTYRPNSGALYIDNGKAFNEDMTITTGHTNSAGVITVAVTSFEAKSGRFSNRVTTSIGNVGDAGNHIIIRKYE